MINKKTNVSSDDPKTDEATSTIEVKSKNISSDNHKTDEVITPTIKQEPIFIKANFSEEIIEIGYIFLATNEQNLLVVSNGIIHMLQGRMYYIPIDKDVDSDDYNIKVHSDISDRFDIRFVKSGLAAVVPIRHNVILKNGEKLCVLTPLNY